MFVKTYVEIPMDLRSVGDSLRQGASQWLPPLAARVEQDGERLLVDVGLSLGPYRLNRPARVVLGEPMLTERVVSIPFRLRVNGGERLFPCFEGSIDAAWLGPERTQVAVVAQYDPPFGLLGRALDRALLHRVAETIASEFLTGIAAHIAEPPRPVLAMRA